MKTTLTRKKEWPKKVACGNATVTVYRRTTPSGSTGFMVSYKGADGRRKFDCFTDEAKALAEADTKARHLSTVGVKAATLPDAELIEHVNCVEQLKPLGISLTAAVTTLAEAVTLVGGLADVTTACRHFARNNKKVIPKRVEEVVNELVALKESRGASERHVRDIRSRLRKFAAAFACEIGSVTTPLLQDWLDGLKQSPRSVKNYRAALQSLFSFAEARGYVFKGGNPVEGTEKLSGNGGGAIEIFTPKEIAALLSSAPANYLPVVALGAFGGLRTAEAERLEWSDIDFAGGFIHVGKDKAKTRSRRLVPIQPNLAQWLAPYAQRKGRVWTGSDRERIKVRRAMLKGAGVKWKHNACRHSYVSYRLAIVQDAAKVALECGNSPQMVFSCYRELVKPADAQRWFSIKPEQPANVVTFSPAEQIANS